MEVKFDFFFGQLPLEEAVAKTLRQQLLAFGFFRESGQKTLRTTLTENDDLSQLYKVYDFILEQVDQVLQSL